LWSPGAQKGGVANSVSGHAAESAKSSPEQTNENFLG
jgi:hypothetical protein